MQALAADLLEAFWACLGERDGRWCAAYSAAGPVWLPAPPDPAQRGSLLLAAARAGVPDLTLSAHLASQLPDRPERFLRPRAPRLLDLCARAGLRPDVRLVERQRQGWRAQDLPRGQWEMQLAEQGLARILFDAPESLVAPFAAGPLGLPWLAHCDDGVFFGYLALDEERDQAVYRTEPAADDEAHPQDAGLVRRAMRYANLTPDDPAGASELMGSLVLCCLHDAADPAVLAQYWREMISPMETDPSVPRARRRELRRQRERGGISAWMFCPDTDATAWSAVGHIRA